MARIGVIIVAGGSGQRMGGSIPKQFMPLCGKPILVRTVGRFLDALPGSPIVVALPGGEIPRWEMLARENGIEGTHQICSGGSTRFESVRNALGRLGYCDLVAVHDGVRPLVSGELILRAIDTASKKGTAVPAIEPADSFRLIDAEGSSAPIDRSFLRAVQTPQVFRYELLVQAYQTHYEARFTDDATVVENIGTKLTLCQGEQANIKITTPFHLQLAEALLKMQDG